MASCHTAEVDGYLIEGHVPAAAIERLLAEQPEAVGLALPGMPPDSPGMGGDETSWADQPVMLIGHRRYLHQLGVLTHARAPSVRADWFDHLARPRRRAARSYSPTSIRSQVTIVDPLQMDRSPGPTARR